MPEQVLHHVERMLDDRPELRLAPLLGPGGLALRPLRQPAHLAALLGNIHEQIPALYLLALLQANVPGIRVHTAFLAMQQVRGLRDTTDIGGRPDNGMHQARYGVHADVRLHAKMPLVPLVVLVHPRIPRLRLVLGRRWRRDDRGFRDRPLAQRQTLLRQMTRDRLEDRPDQVIRLQQPPGVQQRRNIRSPPAQVDSDGRPAALALRVEGLDLLHQQRPRRRRFDLVQKALPARPLLLAGKLQLKQAHLVHALAS